MSTTEPQKDKAAPDKIWKSSPSLLFSLVGIAMFAVMSYQQFLLRLENQRIKNELQTLTQVHVHIQTDAEMILEQQLSLAKLKSETHELKFRMSRHDEDAFIFMLKLGSRSFKINPSYAIKFSSTRQAYQHIGDILPKAVNNLSVSSGLMQERGTFMYFVNQTTNLNPSAPTPEENQVGSNESILITAKLIYRVASVCDSDFKYNIFILLDNRTTFEFTNVRPYDCSGRRGRLERIEEMLIQVMQSLAPLFGMSQEEDKPDKPEISKSLEKSGQFANNNIDRGFSTLAWIKKQLDDLFNPHNVVY